MIGNARIAPWGYIAQETDFVEYQDPRQPASFEETYNTLNDSFLHHYQHLFSQILFIPSKSWHHEPTRHR